MSTLYVSVTGLGPTAAFTNNTTSDGIKRPATQQDGWAITQLHPAEQEEGDYQFIVTDLPIIQFNRNYTM